MPNNIENKQDVPFLIHFKWEKAILVHVIPEIQDKGKNKKYFHIITRVVKAPPTFNPVNSETQDEKNKKLKNS
jgi:hypothetical protein